jgi:hypothetical protein
MTKLSLLSATVPLAVLKVRCSIMGLSAFEDAALSLAKPIRSNYID